MHQLRRIATVVTLMSLTSLPALAKLQNARESRVVFDATATGGLKVEGKTSELTVAENGDAVRLTVPLGHIDTGIGLRNQHLREKLEVAKFPSAELSVPRKNLELPAVGQSVSRTAMGTMTLHGVTKPVQLAYTARSDGPGLYRVHGQVRIKMSDFGITPPGYLGVKVAPDVDVTVDSVVTDS